MLPFAPLGQHCLAFLNLLIITIALVLTSCPSSIVFGQQVGLPIVAQSPRPSLPDRIGSLNNRRHALAILVNQRQYERHVQSMNRMHERHQVVSQRVAEQHNRRLGDIIHRHENMHQEINERHLRRANRTHGILRGSRAEEDILAASHHEKTLDSLNNDNRFHQSQAQEEDHQHLNRIRRSTSSSSSPLPSSSSVPLAEKYPSGSNQDEQAGVKFLKEHDQQSQHICRHVTLASWDYNSNLTEYNKQRYLNVSLEAARFDIEAWKNATSYDWKHFKDPLIRRWFQSMSVLNDAALPTEKLKELKTLIADMENVYGTGKICPYQKENSKSSPSDDPECNLELEPELTVLLAESKDYDELTHVWTAWRNSTGKPIRAQFVRYVELMNEKARRNGFVDGGELWRDPFEEPQFEQQVKDIWEKLRPFYQLLHSYVRKRLRNFYGSERIRPDGPIPAHILGNMWAQSWEKANQDLLLPFPRRPKLDVTNTMKERNMTPTEMFKLSESFFTSIGQKAMTEDFWKNSIIEKPTDRSMVCHASAWDMCNGKDFRIKMCTDVTMEDLVTIHHEMGHIQYYQQYAVQPYVFRNGANPGFHEAVGDALALSVATPQHLRKIGLLTSPTSTNTSCTCGNPDGLSSEEQDELNFLMSIALQKLVFLPFGYMIDLWRWRVFSGEIKADQLNEAWWKARLYYQGVCPPVRRTEDDFDPGAKYHIPGSTPYMRYFVSHIVQFQFHKAMCEASGHVGPLNQCDIYGSKKAGKLFANMLELGSSEKWQEQMLQLTGTTSKMEVGPILEFFEPLRKWLQEQVKGEFIGWKSDDPMICPGH